MRCEIVEHPANAALRKAAYGKLIDDQMCCRLDGKIVGWLITKGHTTGLSFAADLDEEAQAEFQLLAADIMGCTVAVATAPTWTDPDTGEENETVDDTDLEDEDDD